MPAKTADAKRLYFYEIEPGDPEHMRAYLFSHGFVRATPEQIERVQKVADLIAPGYLSIREARQESGSLSAFFADLRIHLGVDVADGEFGSLGVTGEAALFALESQFSKEVPADADRLLDSPEERDLLGETPELLAVASSFGWDDLPWRAQDPDERLKLWQSVSTFRWERLVRDEPALAEQLWAKMTPEEQLEAAIRLYLSDEHEWKRDDRSLRERIEHVFAVLSTVTSDVARGELSEADAHAVLSAARRSAEAAMPLLDWFGFDSLDPDWTFWTTKNKRAITADSHRRPLFPSAAGAPSTN